MVSVRSLEACWHGQVTVDGRDHIVWVSAGAARVALGSRVLRLTAGRAVRIVSGTTVDYISTDRGSVATSVLVPSDAPVCALLRAGGVTVMSDPLKRALLRDFSNWIIPHVETESSGKEITGKEPDSGLRCELVVPQNPTLRRWARYILKYPESKVELTEWAAELGISGRSMSRICVAETGITCRRWQARARIRKSMNLLGLGFSVRETAKSVGYGDSASFSHAFSREIGVPPSRWLILHAVEGNSGELNHERALSLPPCFVPSRVNDFHLLVWQACGVSHIDLGDRVLELRSGQILWIPSGVWCSIHVEEGGVIVPVGQLDGDYTLRRHHIKVKTVPEPEILGLLYLATVNYTILRPYPFKKNDISHLLPFGAGKSLFCSPVKIMMDADCGDSRSLSDWSGELGIERGRLSRLFSQETGCSWESWRREKRMSLARFLLSDTGRGVSYISDRVGYSNVSGFSRSFTAVHGVTPTQFRKENSFSSLIDLPPEFDDSYLVD